jgi:hypothetical protein
MHGEEIAAIAADLLGFAGALLLTVPLFVGQEPRDSVLLALARRSPDAATFDQSTQRHVQHIASNWHWEIRAARSGTVLIALAFLVKIAVGISRYLSRKGAGDAIRSHLAPHPSGRRRQGRLSGPRRAADHAGDHSQSLGPTLQAQAHEEAR